MKRSRQAQDKQRPRARPLYRHVASVLAKDIAREEYPTNTTLPAESELCRRFGVSRHTIRQALRQLREDGLVASRQGAGTIVMKPTVESSYVQTVASIEELVQYATENRYDVNATRLVTCDTRLARRLGCARGEKWLRITGFRYPPRQSIPICWTEVFIRPQFGAVTKKLGRGKGAIYSWIEQIYGQRFADLAGQLQVKPGAPVVEVCRIYRLTTGTVAEIAFNLHPADRFSHSMTLRHTAS
jgi:GntR family transcriptional regulator